MLQAQRPGINKERGLRRRVFESRCHARTRRHTSRQPASLASALRAERPRPFADSGLKGFWAVMPSACSFGLRCRYARRTLRASAPGCRASVRYRPPRRGRPTQLTPRSGGAPVNPRHRQRSALALRSTAPRRRPSYLESGGDPLRSNRSRPSLNLRRARRAALVGRLGSVWPRLRRRWAPVATLPSAGSAWPGARMLTAARTPLGRDALHAVNIH